jgi:hypothetical protein
LTPTQGGHKSDHIVLREDAGSADLRFTRGCQPKDSRVLTVYYINVPQNEERTVKATIWDPAQISI